MLSVTGVFDLQILYKRWSCFLTCRKNEIELIVVGQTCPIINEFVSTHFFYKKRFFSTQRQCCLTFS